MASAQFGRGSRSSDPAVVGRGEPTRAVELEQIEGTEDDIGAMLATPEQLEDRTR
jgi:hypothetical protein